MEPPTNPPLQTDARPLFRKDTTLFGLLRYVVIDGNVRVRPVWSRFFIGFPILCLLGWLALATAAWSFVTYSRKVPDVSFFDIVLPFRWDDYQRKRGNDYLARAFEAQEAGKIAEAVQLYRVGLAKSPGNMEGRRRYASLLSAFGRSDLAVELLEKGLVYAGDDIGYHATFVQNLLANQDDERVLRLAGERLPALAPENDLARLLALSAASASYHRGDYEATERMLGQYNLQRSNEGRLLLTRIDWERGHTGVALLRLQNLISDSPQFEEAHAVRFLYLRQLGRHKEVESAAVLWAVSFPDSVQARVAILYSLHDTGNLERLGREIDALLVEAERQPGVVPAIAEFAINTGNVALADRFLGLLEQGAVSADIATLVKLETRVAARDYAGALSIISELESEQPEWLERHAATLAGLRAVALYGTGSTTSAELQLNAFMSRRAQRTENLLAISRRLQAAGAMAAARRVLDQAAKESPNQAVLTALVELDITTGNLDPLPANLDRLLSMRRPSNDLLRRAEEALGSDRLLFAPERARLLARIQEMLGSGTASETMPGATPPS